MDHVPRSFDSKLFRGWLVRGHIISIFWRGLPLNLWWFSVQIMSLHLIYHTYCCCCWATSPIHQHKALLKPTTYMMFLHHFTTLNLHVRVQVYFLGI